MGSTEDFERRMRRQFYEPRWTSGLVVSTCIFVGASWHRLGRGRGLRELLLSVLVLWFTYLGSVLLHELGHALVARAVNLRPIVLVSGTLVVPPIATECHPAASAIVPRFGSPTNAKSLAVSHEALLS